MTDIYLVRHCEYANPRKILVGRLPVELSEEGQQQAQKLHRFFQDKHIEHIYSSEVLRCQQTAQAISGGIIPISYDQRLLEVFSAYQGFWEYDWSHFYAHLSEVGGEDQDEVLKRILDFWQEKIQTARGNFIICSHGDPLYFLYRYLVHKELPKPVSLGEVVTEPADYLAKGSLRKISINDVQTITVHQMLSQKEL